ncbi:MAG: Do family serine endopeptidase, partial [Pseudomonadota bacterium]
QTGGLADLIEEVSPSVVLITATGGGAEKTSRPDEHPFFDGPSDEFMRRFFERGRPDIRPDQPEHRRSGIGSGFVVAGDGTIVTNHHVIADAETITVTFKDGRTHDASIVGSDPKTDLAVLRLDTDETFEPATWGQSDAVRVGDPVFAVGAPFGLRGTVTAGIVSARGRDIGAGPYDDFIQTDAPINRGNSGGPLFDPSGSVIGVNTAIFGPGGGNVGVGFSIPSDLAREIVEEILVSGTVERGWLGVSIQPVTPDIAEALGLAGTQGALIADIVDGSPADTGDLAAGDIILSYGPTAIQTVRDLTRAVADTDAGETASMSILRAGKTRDVEVEIGDLNATTGEIAADPSDRDEATKGSLGLTLETAGDGVVIRAVRSGSPAARAGLAEGDRLLSVNQSPVATPDDVASAVNNARDNQREAVLFLLERGERSRFVTLPLAPA